MFSSFGSFLRLASTLALVSSSASWSSRLMISMSSLAWAMMSSSGWLSARTISSFLKARTTWQIAWHSRIWARNLFPRPSPLDAPATRPAISTNSTVAGTTLLVSYILAKTSSRSSGTGTMPTFGSMVAKG